MTNGTEVKAAVFLGPGMLELQRLGAPEPDEGELLVRVTCCTLCGSDLHTYQGHRAVDVPTILGHEILGEVRRIGGRVTDLAGRPIEIGDRVTWSVAAHCGDCFYCERGVPQKCVSLRKYGHERITRDHALSGGLAEMCHLAPGTSLIRVPDALIDNVACPANCATATVAGALRTGGGCRDDVVLVQGAGMLGLTACAMAARRGARRVIVCDVDDARLARAESFGAQDRVSVREGAERLDEVIRYATDGRGVDLAVELSGSPDAVAHGLNALRIGGRYVWVGAVSPTPPVEIHPEFIVRRLLNIHGLHNYTPADLADAVDFLEQSADRYPFGELVTRTFALEDVEAAFRYAIDTRPPRVAVTPTDGV